jgi:serine phosphatase RsbU (regulator of sigma subunit)/anti-sigma regulatory factor (Ser/Thr protein kinase)
MGESGMAVGIESIWRRVRWWVRGDNQQTTATPIDRPRHAAALPLDLAPNDPLIAYFQTAPGAVEIDKLVLDSSGLRQLKNAGVKLVVPLVSQGEFVGLLNMGPRLSEQNYSADDRALLSNLGAQAGPAVRVAQLVRQQQEEIAERQRLEQELRVAQLIQRTLLPRQVPAIPGWHVARHYQPAREVGGDFYDFLPLPDGQVGLVIGDVTDKGVPAALVMATTRTLLRAESERLVAPSKVLERVNDVLCADIPPNMFVTCLYAILDPTTGRLRYANAGHDLPYRRLRAGAAELRATGMPLGLMPNMRYEEQVTVLLPGETIVLYSDGLVEAHNPAREMFGFPRLKELVAVHPGGTSLVEYLLDQLAQFTGAGWEQEDDVTLVVVEREMVAEEPTTQDTQLPPAMPTGEIGTQAADGPWRLLDEFTVPSEFGNERLVMQRVADATRELGLPVGRLDRLRTAVAEATMNAMEHGNRYQASVPVTVRVRASPSALVVSVADQGGDRLIVEGEAPDLAAKLAGTQSPRGWGLFLIKNMVDDLRVTTDGRDHVVELVLHLGGTYNGDESP